MEFPDLSEIPDKKRIAAADALRQLKDFHLPPLKYFNSEPCEQHLSLTEGLEQIPPCQSCGIEPRKHQRVGAAWLYFAKRGLIADQVGTGKTAQVATLLALMKETGELDRQRVLVIMRPGAILQWYQQLLRMLPNMLVTTATGTRQERVEKLIQPWNICLIGYQMLNNDLEMLLNFNIRTVVIDDVDALRNRDNKSAYSIKRIARDANRVVILTGTPLQKRLHELHSVLEPIGGSELFGSEMSFNRRYVRTELNRVFNPRMGKYVNKKEVVGYKNLSEFRDLIAPLALRRTADDIDDVDLPAVQSSNIFLELYPSQRKKYDELKRGVLRIIKEEGEKVKQAKAGAAFLYGQQICGGLAVLGEADAPQSSVKFDWVEDMVVDGDLSEEKVVIFVNFKNGIRAIHERLKRKRVGFVTIWGDEPSKVERHKAQEKFWYDKNCRVLLGTTAIEQSLNLQVARHLINVDTILNPARMEQLMGRIRRTGSSYKTVYVHNLLTLATQEANYVNMLRREQAVSDYVWREQSDLFEKLSPLALLQLIHES